MPPSFWRGELGPHLTESRLGEAYLHIKWHLNPSSCLATTDMGAVPLFWGADGSPSNTMWPGSRPTCLNTKFYLAPSNRLATIHQCYSQYRTYRTGQTDRQDRQRSDSVQRTVLQTVAQKLSKSHYFSAAFNVR